METYECLTCGLKWQAPPSIQDCPECVKLIEKGGPVDSGRRVKWLTFKEDPEAKVDRP